MYLTGISHILQGGVSLKPSPSGTDIGDSPVEGDGSSKPASNPEVSGGWRAGRPQTRHPVTHLCGILPEVVSVFKFGNPYLTQRMDVGVHVVFH